MDLAIIVRASRIDRSQVRAAKAEMNLLVATGNEAKYQELRELLADLPIAFFNLKDFPLIQSIEETGATFVENASLKAVGYAAQTKMMTLADDSGLEVDALGGAPGVRSARYAGDAASDLDRVQTLLSEIKLVDESKRTARFIAAIVIVDEGGKTQHVSVGFCQGRIVSAPRGTSGFGYDPIFVPDGYDSTFAELGAEIKRQISPRARALRSTRIYLRNLTEYGSAG